MGTAWDNGLLFPFSNSVAPTRAWGRAARRLVLGAWRSCWRAVFSDESQHRSPPCPPFMPLPEMCWNASYASGPVLGSGALGLSKTGSVPTLKVSNQDNISPYVMWRKCSVGMAQNTCMEAGGVVGGWRPVEATLGGGWLS